MAGYKGWGMILNYEAMGFVWAVTADAADNHGNEWDWTWYLKWDIYKSTPMWSHSQIVEAAVEAPTSLRWAQSPS